MKVNFIREYKFLYLCLLFCTTFTFYCQTKFQVNIKKDYIGKDRVRWKPFFIDTSPTKKVDFWYLPFEAKNRSSFKEILVVSIFGDHRDTYLKNHIHTAIDIIPLHKQSTIYVYPLANGVICSIHLGHPFITIVVKHLLPDSSVVYSSYKHLAEVFVKTGMQVDQNTKLARLYTRQEAKKLGGNYDHLHLEIRKSFSDYGCASWLTMTKDELNRYFYNPLDFLKAHIVQK